MLTWSVTLIGFVIMLFTMGGIFIYYLSIALNNEDSTTIDPLPKQNKKS